MTWAPNLIDRPALEGLQRIHEDLATGNHHRKLSVRHLCLSCGWNFYRSPQSASRCPKCGGDRLQESYARGITETKSATLATAEIARHYFIDKDEAKDLVALAKKKGLIHQ